MALRFQTRLTLTVSALVALTVVVMILLNIWTVTSTVIENYRRQGRTNTVLATSNIDSSVQLPKQIMDQMSSQMVVNALLAAELVAVAEKDAGLEPDAIAAILRRVAQRSQELAGGAPVEEIWVTDETGNAYINTEGETFSFQDDPELQPQSREFVDLLTGDREVVVQELQQRDSDGRYFKYVGVAGVDQQRIIQVGVSDALLEGLEDYFGVQQVVDRFYAALDVARIAVVDANGTVVAAASEAESPGVDGELVRYCQEFIQGGQPFELRTIGSDVGVATQLNTTAQDTPMALFIQYRTTVPVQAIRYNIYFIALVGIITLAISILVSILLSRSFSRPIGQLADGVRAFGRGNLSHRVHLKSHDEIQGLAQTFNAMANSIQDYMHELELETQRRERLESEMRIAAELQASLLPKAAPDLHDVELVGWSRSAKEVGGDFYDYLELGDGRLGVVIGDATGKGLPAALLITECWSVFKAFAEETDSPAELLRRTNAALCRRLGKTGRFITLFFIVIDTRQRKARYAVAGHNPPFLAGCGNGSPKALTSREGYPLGLFPDAEFGEIEIELHPDDTLLLYSDGLTEAHNPDDELYGDQRVQDILADCATQPINDVIFHLRTDVERHMQGRDIFDDMTMVAIRIRGEEQSMETRVAG